MNVRNPTAIFQRNPNLLFLWIGQILSQSGSKMYSISLAWWFLESIPGHAGAWIGALLVLTSLPGILFVRRIGQTVDKGEIKKILKSADLIAALACLVPLVFISKISLFSYVVCGTAFVLSTCQALLDPALMRGIASVAKKEDQEAATGLISSTYSVAGFLGALMGAAAIAAVGLRGSILLNASSYFLAFVFTAMATFSDAIETAAEMSSESAATNYDLEAFFKSKVVLKKLLYLFGAINFFSTPLFVLIPIYTKRMLDMGARELALFEASLWLGMLLGSLSLSLWRFISNPLLLGALAMSAFGFSLMFPVLHANFWIYLSALFLSGYFVGVNNVRFLSLFQESVPLQIQGSFFSRLTALCSFMMPISFLLFGFFADHFDIRILMLLQGMGVLLVTLPLWSFQKQGALL